MNSETHDFEIEIHRIEPRYASMRLQSPSMVEAMTRSIELSGQITPLATISGEGNQYVLMDGYLRLAALKRLGHDRLRIVQWDCDEPCALIRVLCSVQARPWAAIEEARAILLLIQDHGKSQSAIARNIGRDVSWVNRRLSLIETLDEALLEKIAKSKVSLWAASRVLVPLARAKGEHADTMLRFLEHHPLSTRELNTWNQHYQQANRLVRERMVADPALFLAALNNKEQETQAETLRDGPEGKWLHDMKVIAAILRRQQQAIPALFSSPYNREDQHPLRQSFAAVKTLTETIDKALS